MQERAQIQQVSESCLAVVDQRFVSNVGVVIFPDFLVVIDTGKSPSAARMLRETLESTYKRPVRYAVITHYHVDHTAGLGAFSGLAIAGSVPLAERMRDLPEWTRQELERMLEEEVAAQPAADGGSATQHGVGAQDATLDSLMPTLLFDDRIRIVGDKSLEVVLTGGHTDCSSYAYLKEDKVLFGGDTVVLGEFPFAGDATADPEKWIATLKQLQGLDIEHVVPGHGPVTGPEMLDELIGFLEALRAAVLEAIGSGEGPQAVVVPDLRPVHKGKEWFVDATLERWHAYYSDRAGN